MTYDNFIGIDVASQKLDIFNKKSTKHRVIENTDQAVKQFVRTITPETLVIMEATGGYESGIVQSLHEAGIDCVVANPLRVRQFARSCGKLEKTDQIDARMIAEYGEVAQPVLSKPLSPERLLLKELVHRRDQILTQLGAEQRRLKQSRNEVVDATLRDAIAFYKQQLKSIEKRIASTIQQSKELSKAAEILNSCPSVGIATIGILLSELPELGELNRGQIAKLVGVAPLANDSGTKTGQRRTFAGRSLVRKVLYMAALVSTRFNSRMKSFYQSLLSNGKPKKVALVAVMRKLLVTLNTMIKNKEFWRETPLAIDKN